MPDKNSGFRSGLIGDAFIMRQLYIERVKSGLSVEFASVNSAVINALYDSLRRLAVTTLSGMTKTAFASLVNTVTRKLRLAWAEYTDRITGRLEEFTNDEASFVTEALNRVLLAPVEASGDAWAWLKPATIAGLGGTVAYGLQDLGTNVARRVYQAINIAYANRFTAQQLITTFTGTVAANLKDGVLHRLRTLASATVDTIFQAGASTARIGVFKKVGHALLGYSWVSIIDSRTSAVCRSLSGQVFQYGSGPVPPMHLRCRSHIEPVFSSFSVLREGAGRVFSAGESYYNWLSRQSNGLQDDILGPTRGRLFRKGGLTPDEFASIVVNGRYVPLTLAELRKKTPSIFANAGL